MFKIFVKFIETGWYDTPFVNYLVHKGEVIKIGSQAAKVIGGTCLN